MPKVIPLKAEQAAAIQSTSGLQISRRRIQELWFEVFERAVILNLESADGENLGFMGA